MTLPFIFNEKQVYVEACGRILNNDYKVLKEYDNGNGYIYYFENGIRKQKLNEE